LFAQIDFLKGTHTVTSTCRADVETFGPGYRDQGFTFFTDYPTRFEPDVIPMASRSATFISELKATMVKGLGPNVK